MKMGKIMLNGIEYGGCGSSGGAVSGVKGNAESSYRTGDVNLTPENIGAISCKEVHNEDFNDIIDPGFYSVNGLSTKNSPASDVNCFSLIVLDNSGTQGANYPAFHQIAIKDGETDLYVRFGIPSLNRWSNWNKNGLKTKMFFNGSLDIPKNETARIPVGSAGYNAFEKFPILVIYISNFPPLFCYIHNGRISCEMTIWNVYSADDLRFYTFVIDYYDHDDSQIKFRDCCSYRMTYNGTTTNINQTNSYLTINRIIGIGF